MSYEEYAYKVYQAIHVSWEVAHESPTDSDWDFRWGRVALKLEGIWSAALYFVEHDRDRTVWNAVLEDIQLLQDIAEYHADSHRGKFA